MAFQDGSIQTFDLRTFILSPKVQILPVNHGLPVKSFNVLESTFVYILKDGTTYVVMKTQKDDFVMACSLYQLGEK